MIYYSISRVFFTGLVFFYCVSYAISQSIVYDIQAHSSAVIDIAFSHDDKWFASVGADKTIKIWNVETAELYKTLEDEAKEGETAIAFSPCNNFILSGSWDKNVKLWSIEKGIVIKDFSKHTQALRTVDYHSSGKIVASAGWDKNIFLWHVETGTLFNKLSSHNQCIRSIAFNKNGNLIASSGYDCTLKVWNVLSGNEVLSISKAHKYPIEALCFTNDGKYIITGGKDNVVKLWLVSNGQLVKTFTGHTDAVYSVAISPNSRYIFSSSADKTIRIWDIETGKNVSILQGHTGIVKAISIANNAKLLASCSDDGAVKLWNISSLNCALHDTVTSVSQPFEIVDSTNSSYKFILPVNSSMEVYTRPFTFELKVKKCFNDYRLFVNDTEYVEYNGIYRHIIKPVISSYIDTNYYLLKYTIYLEEGLNKVRCMLLQNNSAYIFTQAINLIYCDVSNYAKNSTLNLWMLNTNQPSETNSVKPLLNLFEQQIGKLYSAVNYLELYPFDTSYSSVIDKVNKHALKLTANDLLLFFISGKIITTSNNDYFLLTTDESNKKCLDNAININKLFYELAFCKAYKGIYFDASRSIEKNRKNIFSTSADSLNSLIQNILKSCQSEYSIVIFDNVANDEFIKFFINSISSATDSNENNMITTKEFNAVIPNNIKKYLLINDNGHFLYWFYNNE